MDLDIFSLECLLKNTFYYSSLTPVEPLTLPVPCDRFFFMAAKSNPCSSSVMVYSLKLSVIISPVTID